MKLRGIDFGPALDGAGVRGFFGEGYAYHKFLFPFGLRFEGSTFVAKTTSLHPRTGNMPLKEDGITPRELKPRCIKIRFFKGIVLNAVGLSSPGAKILFEDGRWQKRKEPFFISFAPTALTPEGRITQFKEFVRMFRRYLPGFNAPVGLQINYSCPNIEAKIEEREFIDEVKRGLQIASTVLNIPLMPKFNILIPVEIAKEIADDPNCDALCVTNTIPWGALSQEINWKDLFGSSVSPLAHLGGGGLSGKLLLKLVAEWVREARKKGLKKPINAGGGILSPQDVDLLYEAGASSVFIGSIAILRPWRIEKTIERAHKIFKEKIEYSNTKMPFVLKSR